MLVPHAASSVKQVLRNEVKNIGFVASEYAPNVDAITWFLNKAWPIVNKSRGLTLNIYGRVSNLFPQELISNNPDVRLHGFVNNIELVYTYCDIIINPVRCGAGLKIKNIEALSHSLPLITTTHGSIGIADGAPDIFITANTPVEFARSIEKLVDDPAWRTTLAANAYTFVERKFSPAVCYQELVDYMLEFQLIE